MKICIIGPCSTGKSTLALKLSKKYGVESYNLDSFYIDFDSITVGARSVFSLKKIDCQLNEVLKKKNWIVEGPYFEPKILNGANMIIFTPRNLTTALLWQWKRFFTDPVQIKKWGVVNNLLLSKLIFNQYLDKGSYYLFQEVRYPTLKYLNKVLSGHKYQNKVQVLKKNNSVPVIK